MTDIRSRLRAWDLEEWKDSVAATNLFKSRKLYNRVEAERKEAAEVIDKLVEALVLFHDEYIENAGLWDPDQENKVKLARSALAAVRGE